MEELKKLLGEELFNQVKEAIGDKELIINDGSYIPKSRFDEVNNERNSLKEQLQERDKQLEDLKKQAKDSEELQNQIKQLQKQNEETQQEYEQRLNEQKFDFAVEQALLKHEAKNVKAVKALLNSEKISLDDNGNLIGLEEQVKELKENEPYLFGKEVKGRSPTENTNPPPEPDNPWRKETWNLTKQGQIIRDDPELAERLKKQAGVKK